MFEVRIISVEGKPTSTKTFETLKEAAMYYGDTIRSDYRVLAEIWDTDTKKLVRSSYIKGDKY